MTTVAAMAAAATLKIVEVMVAVSMRLNLPTLDSTLTLQAVAHLLIATKAVQVGNTRSLRLLC
eukprot:4576963-Prorocentrum_lima.AAC.1